MHRLLRLTLLATLGLQTTARADLFREPWQATPEQRAEFAARYAPMPVIEIDASNRYVYGRVLDVVARPNAMLPWVRIMAVDHTGRTSPIIERPITEVSSHDFDGRVDLVRAFSDRFERAGIAFDSPEHHALILRTLDPDGSLGVGDGTPPPNVEPRTEGRLFAAALEGTITTAEWVERRRPYNPLAGAPAIVELKGPATMGVGEMLRFAAIAERYPAAFEPHFAAHARAAVRALLALAPCDASRADEAQRMTAIQLECAGVEALEMLCYALEERLPLDLRLELARLEGRDPNKVPMLIERVFPLSLSDEIRAAARIVAAEPTLQHFYGRKPGADQHRFADLAPSIQPIEPPIGLGFDGHDPDHDLISNGHSGRLARAMLRAASPSTHDIDTNEQTLTWRYDPDAETVALLRGALIGMATGSAGLDDAERSAHLYRRLLFDEIGYFRLDDEPARSRLAAEILAAADWGEPREVIPVVDDLFDNTMGRVPYGFALTDTFEPNSEMAFALLRTWAQGGSGRTATIIQRRLESKLNEVRERARQKEDPDSHPARLLRLWAARCGS